MIDLLAHRIKTLALNRDAPFPSEIKDAHQAVREWRHEQRCKLVRSEHSLRGRDPGDLDPVPDLGE